MGQRAMMMSVTRATFLRPCASEKLAMGTQLVSAATMLRMLMMSLLPLCISSSASVSFSSSGMPMAACFLGGAGSSSAFRETGCFSAGIRLLRLLPTGVDERLEELRRIGDDLGMPLHA